jgi:hypothetical protein
METERKSLLVGVRANALYRAAREASVVYISGSAIHPA